MSDRVMRRASLADVKTMKDAGELFHDAAAPEGESLGAAFWDRAEIVEPKRPRSVHLKIDPDVFDFFYAQSKGKGHLTRMQNVLKAYANAKK